MWKQLWKWVLGRGWKRFEARVRRTLATISRSVDIQGSSREAPERNVTGQRRKGDSCHKVPKDLAGSCSSVLCKLERMTLDI